MSSLKCVYVILLVAFINEAKGGYTPYSYLDGGESSIDLNDSEVQEAVTYIYTYIKDNSIISTDGYSSSAVLNSPTNVQGTSQIVAGTLYDLTFEIIVAPCEGSDEVIDIYSCKAGLVDQPWKNVRYYWDVYPTCCLVE